MAKKAKSSKKGNGKNGGAKKQRKVAVKMSAAQYKAMAAGISRGKVPATVGEHFRARIVEGKLENPDIVKEVKAKHKGSKAKLSDLYWNRQYLKHHDGIRLG